MSGSRCAPRVEVEQLRRGIADLCSRSLAGLLPLVTAELVQRRRFGGSTRVTADAFERLHRYVELVFAGVLEQQELGGHAANVHRHQTPVTADAVILVDDGGAGAQVGELLDDTCRV